MPAIPKKPSDDRDPVPESNVELDPADQAHLRLSERDRDTVMRLLDAPPQPNQNLRAAAERFKARNGQQ